MPAPVPETSRYLCLAVVAVAGHQSAIGNIYNVEGGEARGIVSFLSCSRVVDEKTEEGGQQAQAQA